jgi:hypothetical protein
MSNTIPFCKIYLRISLLVRNTNIPNRNIKTERSTGVFAMAAYFFAPTNKQVVLPKISFQISK